MLPLILAGLAGAAVTAIIMSEDEETKKRDDAETVETIDNALEALNISQETMKKQTVRIKELEQMVSELTAKEGVLHGEVIEPINTCL